MNLPKIKIPLFALAIIGVSGCIGVRAGDSGKVERQVTVSINNDPYADVKDSLHKGDRRFVGVYGAVLAVPGIPENDANSLVQLHGVKTISGTTDFINNSNQEEFNRTATIYAKKYNLLLLNELMNKPDKKTKKLISEVRKELQMLEKSDPVKDSMKSFKNSGAFIMVAQGVLGVPNDGVDPLVGEAGTRLLKSSPIFFGQSDKARFSKVISTYVIPYNRNLYNLLKTQGK